MNNMNLEKETEEEKQDKKQKQKQSDEYNDDNVNVNIDFFKIIKEFIPDLLNTFPEYEECLCDGVKEIIYTSHTKENEDDAKDEDVKITHGMIQIYKHSKSILPKRFFDILYQNEDIFTRKDNTDTDTDTNTNTDTDTEFIKGIHFRELWNTESISEQTKCVIWKYLQMLLFSVVTDIDNESVFGDTAKLFEAIDETKFHNKLEDILGDIHSFFDEQNGKCEKDKDTSTSESNKPKSTETNEPKSKHFSENMPNADTIHEHIHSMMNGNLGKLAQEIAEETFEELEKDDDLKDEMTKMKDRKEVDTNDVFKLLFNNPQKIMKLSKKISGKIDHKLKSGDINEQEMMQEASDMMNKMKNIPGMGNMNDILKKFGGMMGGDKSGSNHAYNNLSQRFQKMNTRDRLMKKLKDNQDKLQTSTVTQGSAQTSNDTLPDKITIGDEIQEKTPRVKKKKNRKGKGKGKGKK